MARLLLASGADPNRADGCGRTALKVTRSSISSLTPFVVDFFLLLTRTSSFLPRTQLAIKGGHKKVIQLLENWAAATNAVAAAAAAAGAGHANAIGSSRYLSVHSNGTNGGIHRDYSPASTFETGVSGFTSSAKTVD